LIRVID